MMVTGLPVTVPLFVVALVTATMLVAPTTVVLPQASIAVTAAENESVVLWTKVTEHDSGVGHEKDVPVPVTTMLVNV